MSEGQAIEMNQTDANLLLCTQEMRKTQQANTLS